ncbi:MAG: tetratricopeptide repeat protein [Thermoguttaceae bacterium]
MSIYLGSPWYYGLTTSYYYEPYYVPYFVPYTVPLPYVVETEVLESEPAAAPEPRSGAVIGAAGDAADYQLAAEEAFREHRYEDAARLSNHAIVEDGQNGKLHLFASQTFFALGDYASAAGAVQQAAALLDPDEWGFVIENYQEFYRGDDYLTQMAKLNEYLVENPEAAYAWFLRGYHFLFLGHKDAARNDLARAVQLESRDRLAGELLGMAGGQLPGPSPVPPPVLPPASGATATSSAAESVPAPPAETPAP